ncbi:MAG TPA: polysaccharide deacetylase family protein [Acidisarcina sp.]|nr:polysaccharide deacetylase family protein [Acidisarcina sp.]
MIPSLRVRRFLAVAGALFLLTSSLRAQQAMPRAGAAKTIALSFDDLPVSTIGQDPSPAAQQRAQEITTKILATLKKHGAPAIGFVNEQKLNTPGARDARTSLLENWLRAGMLLGNHGYSHLAFGEVSLADYEDDFLRGDVITPLLVRMHSPKDAPGPRYYYRYPYNDTGDTAAKKQAFLAFLTSHHYAIAPMTFENDDWMYSALYESAAKSGDQTAMERLRAAYMEESERKIARMEQLSQDSFGRQIAEIADLHVNQMNADALDDLLTLFEHHGYRFARFDEALADPAYRTRDEYVGSAGISWLYRWQSALGRKTDFRGEPYPPQWVQDAYKKLIAK